MKETVTLNTQEQKRMLILNRLEVGHLTAAETAGVLTLSERQVRRLSAAYRKEGGSRVGPWESRQEADTGNQRGGTTPGDRAGHQ